MSERQTMSRVLNKIACAKMEKRRSGSFVLEEHGFHRAA
jgi:hypothetical protein